MIFQCMIKSALSAAFQIMDKGKAFLLGKAFFYFGSNKVGNLNKKKKDDRRVCGTVFSTWGNHSLIGDP